MVSSRRDMEHFLTSPLRPLVAMDLPRAGVRLVAAVVSAAGAALQADHQEASQVLEVASGSPRAFLFDLLAELLLAPPLHRSTRPRARRPRQDLVRAATWASRLSWARSSGRTSHS